MNSLKAIIITLITLFATVFSSAPSNAIFSGNPIFVEITTEWCGACKMLKPVIEDLKKEYEGKVTFIKLDATDEQSIIASRVIARQYGLEEFFEKSRDVFPRVGIFCSNSSFPDQNLIGFRKIEAFREVLNGLALEGGLCNLSDSIVPEQADLGPGRPGEPEYPIVTEGRPDIPLLDGRPIETLSVGRDRPKELSFWQVGQPIPFYAYFQYFLLPECSGSTNVICSNYGLENNDNNNSGNTTPIFTPWDPNATRNEKGFESLKKG